MLKLLHTADLHLGLESAQFDADARRRLARARLDVARTILSVAEQYAVDAVLWAGDIFDTPEPGEDWWRGFANVLTSRDGWSRPVVLLPGNHDPLKPGSVYHATHPFRALLPPWVHVVDSDAFALPLTPDAVLLAAPCRSTAGAEDLALSLPARAEGDTRIRIGMVHGSTFDIEGHQTNFPVARDAPARRGLDYLAVGDTHGFRILTDGGVAPIVYPGAPEQTRFGESDAGHVALVTLMRAGAKPMVTAHKVGRWAWRQETITSLEALHRLASEDLDHGPSRAARHDGPHSRRDHRRSSDAATAWRRRQHGPRGRAAHRQERASHRRRRCRQRHGRCAGDAVCRCQEARGRGRDRR